MCSPVYFTVFVTFLFDSFMTPSAGWDVWSLSLILLKLRLYVNMGADKVHYGCGNTPGTTQMSVKSVASSKPTWLPANHPNSPTHVHLRALIGWRRELVRKGGSAILRPPLLHDFSFLRHGEVKVTRTGRALPFVRTGPRAKERQSIDHHVQKAVTEHRTFQSTRKSTGGGDAVLLTAITNGMKDRGEEGCHRRKDIFRLTPLTKSASKGVDKDISDPKSWSNRSL